MKPSEVTRKLGVHIILYGEPKSGKSTLVSQLLKSGKYKLWWLSLDNGHEVLWKLNLTQEQLDERLELFVIPDTRSFQVALKTVRSVCSGGPVDICDSHGQSSCSICRAQGRSFSHIDLSKFTEKDILVIDHGGQLSNSITAYISKSRSKDDEEASIYKMTQPDWGVHGAILDGIFTNIQQSKANIVVLAHTIESEQEDGKKKLYPQIGSANFSRNAAKYFGHVIYLLVNNLEHKLGSSTTYANNVITGSRTDVEIEKMNVPSLEPFFDRVIKGNDKLEQSSPMVTKINAPTNSEQLKTINSPAFDQSIAAKLAALSQIKKGS